MAYVGILENELDQFNQATDVVGKALQHVNLQELEGKLLLLEIVPFVILHCRNRLRIFIRITVCAGFSSAAAAMSTRKRDGLIAAMKSLLQKA